MSEEFGLLARFDTPERLVEAAGKARKAGLVGLDAFTPFAVEGLAEALGQRPPWTRFVALGGGIVGAACGYGMQVWANTAYPLDIGGRPASPPQAFGLITFELMVLGAVLAMVVGFFLTCRLPRLNHPLFACAGFERATVDGYFLLVPVADTGNDRAEAEKMLKRLKPADITVVPR